MPNTDQCLVMSTTTHKGKYPVCTQIDGHLAASHYDALLDYAFLTVAQNLHGEVIHACGFKGEFGGVEVQCRRPTHGWKTKCYDTIKNLYFNPDELQAESWEDALYG